MLLKTMFKNTLTLRTIVRIFTTDKIVWCFVFPNQNLPNSNG